MKVLLPLEIEPATSNAGGIEGTIGLLGCSSDHAIMSLFQKSLLPKNFNLRRINANEGLLIKGVTGNSLKNAGT